MEKEKIRHYYSCFRYPLKEEYVISKKIVPAITVELNNCPVHIYGSDENEVEYMVVEMEGTLDNKEELFSAIKQYVQSLLRLSFEPQFKFTDIIFRMNVPYKKEKDLEEIGFVQKFTLNKNKPKLNKTFFRSSLGLFAHNSESLDLFTESLNPSLSSIMKYFNLYKIVEWEYHAEGKKNTRTLLKASKLLQIVKEFEYEGKKGEKLIDYIVELRDKCSHLKKISIKEKYGFVNSSIKDRREVDKFIPTMQKICIKVVNPNAEIEIVNNKRN